MQIILKELTRKDTKLYISKENNKNEPNKSVEPKLVILNAHSLWHAPFLSLLPLLFFVCVFHQCFHK